MPKPGPRTTYRYSDDFKATAVRLSQLSGVLVQDVAASLYIHPFMLSRWRQRACEGVIMTKRVAVDKAVAVELKGPRRVKKACEQLQIEHDLLTIRGGCHCKRVRVEFTTHREPGATNPRACDCSFCKKHGAAYISDPAGQLRILVGDPSALRSYRQGSETAEFRLCSECGVLVAVTFEHAGRLYGAVNVACLDGDPGLGTSIPASPQSLSPGQKVARWLQVWVPDVQLLPADT
jgi:hypothetical protein